MQAAIMSKIDAKIFEKRTGVSIEQIFNPLTRVEVWINAEDMVASRLVKKENVTTLTPVLSAEIKSKTGIILEAYRERTPAPTSDITVTGSQYVNNLTNNNWWVRNRSAQAIVQYFGNDFSSIDNLIETLDDKFAKDSLVGALNQYKIQHTYDFI